MILRLQKYHLTLQYCPGSKIYIADMLSRAYITDHKEKEEKDIDVFKLKHEEQLFKDIKLIKQAQHLHMRDSTQAQIKKATAEDPTMQTLAEVVQKGWPETRNEVPVSITTYWGY